jgi:hypothetical protein
LNVIERVMPSITSRTVGTADIGLLPADEAFGQPDRDTASMVSISIRSTFRMIANFIEAQENPKSTAGLVGPAYAACELGRMSFELAAKGFLIDHRLCLESALCTERIARLAAVPSVGDRQTREELRRAVDGLIVLLFRLEGAVARSLAHAVSNQ